MSCKKEEESMDAGSTGERARRAPTVKDVARAANVSTATVSRVVSKNGYPVADATRERVLAVVADLGYSPNDLARSLLKERTRTIGIIVPELTNPHHPEIVHGVEDVAEANGYSLMFCSIDGNASRLSRYLEMMTRKRIDGLIMAAGGIDLIPFLDKVSSFPRQTVIVGGRVNATMPGIGVDNIAAGRLAAEHLLSLGHRAIGIIRGPKGSKASDDRVVGAHQTLAEAGIPSSEVPLRNARFLGEDAYEVAHDLLTTHPELTAIIAGNDLIAVATTAAAQDLGLRIPEQLAVVGYDDIKVAQNVRPSLTTIRLPAREMGQQAMRTLVSLIEGKPVPKRVTLGVELIVRGSTVRDDGLPSVGPRRDN
jgi:LacI family transcriptional regulator